jgi:hypothetical protein
MTVMQIDLWAWRGHYNLSLALSQTTGVSDRHGVPIVTLTELSF